MFHSLLLLIGFLSSSFANASPRSEAQQCDCTQIAMQMKASDQSRGIDPHSQQRLGLFATGLPEAVTV